MAGVLENIKVIDLSFGIAGPIATMLLGDNGADVVRVEPPAGDPWESSGYMVWQRNKRSAVLDVHDPTDRDALIDLVSTADVVVESFAPGTAQSLGIDHRVLLERNPSLVHCSITGYGEHGALAARPGIDALVAARTGQQWEARGIAGGALAHLAGVEGALPGMPAPDGLAVGAPRPGPLFAGVPWVSLGAAYLAAIGVSAALRAREVTGRGQHLHTSLLQGALATTVYPWQRAESPDADYYQSWVIDPRAPKGFHRCADGRWVHQWAPLPSFMLAGAEGDRLEVGDDVASPRRSSMRVGLEPTEMLVLHEFMPSMSEAASRFSSDEWTAFAASVGVPLQPVRSPEEALLDPLLLDDGCVTEIDVPGVGPVRQVGVTYRLSACPPPPFRPPAPRGAHTDDVRAEAATARSAPRPQVPSGSALSSPLEGITVIDLGLAAAGPFGAQLLGQLGAKVIKVQPRHDGYWMSSHLGMSCNMGKQSLAIDLKTPEGLEVLHRLVDRADVVHTNMRYGAAQKLGVDYDALRAIRPDLIYCHTRGFERGERDSLPGNDQTGAALAGIDWLDGGLDDDGTPIWPNTSLGDTGNGLLSAIAVVQALYHRDRTGEGQFVDTSIMYAHLLNTSMAWITADGETRGDRPSLDQMQLGWHPLYRLYATEDDWISLAAVTDQHWTALVDALDVPELRGPRFASCAARDEHASALEHLLGAAFAERPSAVWVDLLDAAGVPCEATHEERVCELFDDPDVRERRWIASYEHPVIGRVDAAGLLVDFDATPGVLWGAAPTIGQHSRNVLHELGYDTAEVEQLVVDGIVLDGAG